MKQALPLLVLLSIVCYTSCAPPEQCGKFRRMYIDIADRGYISPANFTNLSCGMELVTCPSCVISITVLQMNLLSCSHDNSCRCQYLHFHEPPYEASGKDVCGDVDRGTTLYGSLTRFLDISLVSVDGSDVPKDAFLIEYSAERNRRVVRGLPAPAANSTGRITSPFFPSLYPKDISSEILILTNDPASRVQLLFDDFQISPWSILEFYDWNGSRLEATGGGNFRPPAILSTGPALLIRFFANGGTGPGFKAQYTYLPSTVDEAEAKPITDCGGFVDDTGGAITMMHMADTGIRTYDCIWLIRPPRTIHSKTHLYLKVAKFSDMARKAVVEIRQGLTSDSLLLESVRYPTPTLHLLPLGPRQRELVIPASTGFYVRLKASFDFNSRLAIVYTAFSFLECFSGSDFLCHNHRCVPAEVRCDGFDHCGDGSDEPSSCADSVTASSLEPRWYSHTPNYYFPRTARYPDLRTAATVFIATTLGLLVLIAALIVLMYRMGARARRQRDLQNRLRTISGILDNLSNDGVRIEEVIEVDEPPDYEAPPEYEDVVKALFEGTSVHQSRRRGRQKRNQNHGRLETTPRLMSPSPATPRAPLPSPIPDSPPPAYSLSLEFTPSLQNIRGSLTSLMPSSNLSNINISNLTGEETLQTSANVNSNDTNNSLLIPVVPGFNVNNIIRNLFSISSTDEGDRTANTNTPHSDNQLVSTHNIPSITTSGPSNDNVSTIESDSSSNFVIIDNSSPSNSIPSEILNTDIMSLSIPITSPEQSVEIANSPEINTTPASSAINNGDVSRSGTTDNGNDVIQPNVTTVGTCEGENDATQPNTTIGDPPTDGVTQEPVIQEPQANTELDEIMGSTSSLHSITDEEFSRGHRRLDSRDSRITEHWVLDDGDSGTTNCGCDGACPCARLASISRESSLMEEDLNMSHDNLSEMSKSRESLDLDQQEHQDRPPVSKGRSVPSLQDIRSRSLDIVFSIPGDESDVVQRQQRNPPPLPVLIEDETRPLITPTEENKPFIATSKDGRVLVHETCNRIENLLRQSSQDYSDSSPTKQFPIVATSSSCTVPTSVQSSSKQQTPHLHHIPKEQPKPQKSKLILTFPSSPLPPIEPPIINNKPPSTVSNSDNMQIPNPHITETPHEDTIGIQEESIERNVLVLEQDTITAPKIVLKDLPTSTTIGQMKERISLNGEKSISCNTISLPSEREEPMSSLRPSHSLESGRLLTAGQGQGQGSPKDSTHRRCQSVTIPCLGVRGAVPYRRL